jgi:hypothetical protein
MRILHLMLSCFYIDNYNYQENVLPRQNKLDGHDVQIIASTQTFVDNVHPGYLNPGTYINEDGIPVIRLPFTKIVNNTISSKLKIYPKVYQHLISFSPDVIFCHGMQTYELKTLIKYKTNNPDVRLYFDSHADFNNSAKGFLSRNILHRLYYKWLISQALPFIDKIFCINYESIVFLQKMYEIPRNKLVIYPLGGVVLEDDIRNNKRRNLRKTLNLSETDILLIHCGKMEKAKCTEDIMKAFFNIKRSNLRLILIGSMAKDIELSAKVYLQNDSRIKYLGWKNTSELADYLCAGDLYVQPGSQSATMQNALCYGCAAALYPYESHTYLLGDRVFYIETLEDMEHLFEEISLNRNILEKKRKLSFEFAKSTLDYKKLAALLYN